MISRDPVLYSLILYVLYVLLPLIPAVVTFWLFPEGTVAVEGPLQNLTVKATGAFAAYVVTVALGFFLVNKVETQIIQSRDYAFRGVIVDLGQNQYVRSDGFYSEYVTAANSPGTKDYNFVVVLDHPVVTPEPVLLQYWELSSGAGLGSVPIPVNVTMELPATTSFPARFILRIKDNKPVIELVDKITAHSVSN